MFGISVVHRVFIRSDMLRLTCLYVTDHSGVIKRTSEKTSPTGGPAGITHSSRMAGVNPQASSALCSIPHLPDMRNPHCVTASNKNWWLQHVTFTHHTHIWEKPMWSSQYVPQKELLYTDHTIKPRTRGYLFLMTLRFKWVAWQRCTWATSWCWPLHLSHNRWKYESKLADGNDILNSKHIKGKEFLDEVLRHLFEHQTLQTGSGSHWFSKWKEEIKRDFSFAEGICNVSSGLKNHSFVNENLRMQPASLSVLDKI